MADKIHISHTENKRTDASELTKTCHNELDSLNMCNSHFFTVGAKLADRILAQLLKTEVSLASSVKLDHRVNDSSFMNPTDTYEIKKLLTF